MRAVLDTVIFVRALINPRGQWGRLVFELADRYVIVVSPEVVSEIMAVLYRPTLRRRFPQMADPPRLDEVIRLVAEAELLHPSETPRVCRDTGDDKFFACALAGQADYIVTKDEDILAVGDYEGILTIQAGDFTRLLEKLP